MVHVCPCDACLPPPDGRHNGCPRGDATQQALLLGQAARHVHALLAAHSEHLIQNAGVQHLGNKASTYALYLQHPSLLSKVQCLTCVVLLPMPRICNTLQLSKVQGDLCKLLHMPCT